MPKIIVGLILDSIGDLKTRLHCWKKKKKRWNDLKHSFRSNFKFWLFLGKCKGEAVQNVGQTYSIAVL